MLETNKKTILLIDDDHDIVDSTSLRLTSAGYKTIAAYGGEEGVASAINDLPDAIVLDIRMPGMDGLNALAELKQRADTKHIPVVMLSASVIDQNRCLDAGARFFVRKPYTSKHLIAAVDTAMSEETTN